MNTTTVANRTVGRNGPADLDMILWVTDQVAVDYMLHGNGAHVQIGTNSGGGFSIRTVHSTPGDNPMVADLDHIEKFLYRCLDAVTAGKKDARIRAARTLPCGGGCQLDTWPADTWICPAATNDGDHGWFCALHDGHTGPHIACRLVGDIAHNLHRWGGEA